MNNSKITKKNKNKEYFIFKFRPSYGGDLRIIHKRDRGNYGKEKLNELIINPEALAELKEFYLNDS